MSELKKYRQKRGLTRVALSEILECSTSLIAACEKGRRRVTADNAIKWERLSDGDMSRQKLSPEHFGKGA